MSDLGKELGDLRPPSRRGLPVINEKRPREITSLGPTVPRPDPFKRTPDAPLGGWWGTPTRKNKEKNK